MTIIISKSAQDFLNCTFSHSNQMCFVNLIYIPVLVGEDQKVCYEWRKWCIQQEFKMAWGTKVDQPRASGGTVCTITILKKNYFVCLKIYFYKYFL